jgi:hypothetical protein
MIFFFDARGNLIKSVPSDVKQGSNKASRVWFLMPTSSGNHVDVAFTLANGEHARKRPMTLATDTGIPDYKDQDGKQINAWYLDLLKDFTAYAGIATAQFFVTSSDEVITTKNVEITVLKGSAPSEFPLPDNDYDDIIQAIMGIKDIVTNFEEDIIERFDNLQKDYEKDFNELEIGINSKFNELSATINNKFEETDVAQVIKNKNNIDALFNLQIKKNVLVYENAELVDERQQTGGADLEGLEVLDGSYATVKKIQGNTVAVGNALKHAKISGIKSTGRNLFNPNRTVVEDFGEYSPTKRTFTPNSIIKGLSLDGYYNADIIENYFYSAGKLSFSNIVDNYGVGFNFDCEPNKKYVFSYKSSSANIVVGVSFYKDGLVTGYKQTSGSFTTPSDCDQVVILVWNITPNEVIEITGLQLECGETATDYTPYTESVMNLFETVELGKWDYIENGKFIKRTETLKLTGAERWYDEEDRYSTTAIDTIANMQQPTVINSQNFSSQILNRDAGLQFLSDVKELYPTLDSWKNYLNNNPLTIAFELANPYTVPLSSSVDYKYQVWDKGQEIIDTPKDSTGHTCFDYGANTTEVNNYYVIVGGND